MATVQNTPENLIVPTRKSRLTGATRTALMMLNDTLMILVSFGIAALLRTLLVGQQWVQLSGIVDYRELPLSILYLPCFALVFIITAYRYGLYSPTSFNSGGRELRLTIQGCANAGFVLCGVLYIFHAFLISRAVVILLVVIASIALCIDRRVVRYYRIREYENGIGLRNIVVLGTNQLSYALGDHLERNPSLGYRFAGFLTIPNGKRGPEISSDNVLGSLHEIDLIVRSDFIDDVVIAEYLPIQEVISLVEMARELNVDVQSISGYYNDFLSNAPVEYMGIFPLASLHRREVRTFDLFLKRVLDLVLSPLFILMLSLPMAAIALAIKFDSKGPVFYVSERVGKRGRLFRCLKFRTMVENAEAQKDKLLRFNEREGVLFKMKSDPRITRLGGFLRKYSLDELPQLFNVLKGEMSMVGPRPPIASEVAQYKLEQLHRLDVMPGLTGLWQVEARQDRSFAKYIALDMSYVENWNFWLDLRILVRTVGVVLAGTGD